MLYNSTSFSQAYALDAATGDSRLIALNAEDGRPVEHWGGGGVPAQLVALTLP